MQALRGVSEGDVTRYALERREPLLVELEAFCALLRGEDGAAVVTLDEGLETVVGRRGGAGQRGVGETVARPDAR